MYMVVGKVCIQSKWPIRPELILVTVAWCNYEYFYSPLDGMLVHHRVNPSIILERGTQESLWKCLARQHNVVPSAGLKPTLPNPEPRALTIRQLHLPHVCICICMYMYMYVYVYVCICSFINNILHKWKIIYTDDKGSEKININCFLKQIFLENF